MPTTRKITDIALIDNVTPEISGNQLPSKEQVLKCYFYHKRHATPKLTGRKAATLVVRKCAIFWEYAGIPIVKECHAIAKLEKLVERHENLLKNGSRMAKYENTKVKQIAFQIMLRDLFDIAHQTQAAAMKNEAAKILLSLHRETGRKEALDRIIDTGIWVVRSTSEDKEKENKAGRIEQARSTEIAANYANYILDDDEDIDELLKQFEDSEEVDNSYEVSLTPTKAKKLKIVTPDMTAIIDRAKISNRMAARLIAGTLIISGVNLENVSLSTETLRRNRHKGREILKNQIVDDVKNRPSHIKAVHWDGKQLPSPENKHTKIDRLPVLVSSHDWSQLLAVPRLEKGSGELQATAVYNCLKEWDLLDDVCAMVFDTTASNTGNMSGTCVLLEKLLGRNLLHLACRHHIFELLLRAAFECSMGSTSGPGVPIFERLRGGWGNIEQGGFSPGVDDVAVKKALHCSVAESLAFAEEQLKRDIIRNDYREFLELVVMFLGGNLTKGNHFRALGPIHHARWMAKAIYSLKFFMFRDQFQLTSQERSGLRDICIFIVLVYQRAWFTASNTVNAPNNDLHLLKALSANTTINAKICKVVFEKFSKHLWYLSEELIGFAFFDENVSVDCKRKMCQAIKSRSPLSHDRKKKKIVVEDKESIQKLDIDSFVTTHTYRFFEILKIDSTFLDNDPTSWEGREDFHRAFETVRSLHSTNDIAERTVALISEYNDLLTKDEGSKQHALLAIQKLRELSSGCTKKDLNFSLQNYLNDFPMNSANNIL